ncbi:unnamed protein product [Amoebophrya sp. A25]|nr:unnamed protein product [Amoebophrya sp. A25]|eukprot:GSA25T00019455001.1
MGFVSFLDKLRRLPQEWLLPFLQDYLFYAAFIVIFSTIFGHLGANLSVWDRISLVVASTFCWAWFLIFGYMALQAVPGVLEKFSLVHGLSAEMRELYSLPKFIGEKLTFWDLWANCLRNQVVYFGVAALCWRFQEGKEVGEGHEKEGPWSTPAAPLYEVLFGVLIYMILFDILLSIGHRLLHTHLYFWHKQHHSQRGSLPAGGWYMHIIDLFMELWFPIFLPPLLFSANWLTVWTWLFLVEWDGVHTHAALDFWPGVIPGPRRHWLHHMLYFGNFGPGLGDYFLETEVQELAKPGATAKLKDEMSLVKLESLRSMRELKMSKRADAPPSMLHSFLEAARLPIEFESSEEARIEFYHGMDVPDSEPMYYTRIAGVEDGDNRRGLTYIRM